MQIQRCNEDTPTLTPDTFFSGRQLKGKSIPEGVYKYVTDKSHHTESVRYIVLGTSSLNSQRILIALNLNTLIVTPGCPNDNTQFIKTNERLIMDIAPGE